MICVFRFFLVPLQRLWLFMNKKEVFMNVGGKIITILSTLAVVALVVFVYVKFFFVYSQGVNEGDINYFQYEGFVFKTYEGKMIQTL